MLVGLQAIAGRRQGCRAQAWLQVGMATPIRKALPAVCDILQGNGASGGCGQGEHVGWGCS